MNLLFIIAAALLHARGNTAPKPRKRRLTEPGCETPLQEYEPYCASKALKYYYDHKSKKCQSFFWNGCLPDGVYHTRIDCANQCNPEEEAGICEERRVSECSGSSVSWKQQYYYNITNQACEAYNICNVVGDFMAGNTFNSKTLCILQCRGFTLNHTKSGRSDGRQLLGMLDTPENIWIYKIRYNNSFPASLHTCIKYTKHSLDQSKYINVYGHDYDYDFFYEWVEGNKTYNTRYSGYVGHDNKTSSESMVYRTEQGSFLKTLLYWNKRRKCGIVRARRNTYTWCELHVWENYLRESYWQSGNYTDCQEELFKHCPNSTERLLIQPSCPNVYFKRYGSWNPPVALNDT